MNVTSLTWLDVSRAYTENGAVWSHQVFVVVPKKLTIKNASTVILNGGCIGDSYPGPKDEYLEIADRVASQTESISVVVNQIPNCKVIFPSDPEKKPREEDAILAWAWKQFIEDPKQDPEWLPRLPMAKVSSFLALYYSSPSS